MHALANPARFMRYSARLLPWAGILACLLLIAGLWYGLMDSPPDYQQGEMVRVMYIHVPAAWMSLLVYSVMAGASAVFLIWRHPLADVTARASALIGIAFTFVTLVTGSIWGKPTWGAWWVWDARLTSVLVLFFLYLGYIAMTTGLQTEERMQKAAAVLALLGFVNIPIIKFSVDWWNSLHQPASIIRLDGPHVDPSMLKPLLLMIAGFAFFYVWLLLVRVRTMLMQQKIRRLQLWMN